MKVPRHALLLAALLLFCLGTVFQFNGVFGDPYLQQLAIVATWLPVVLAVLFAVPWCDGRVDDSNNIPATVPSPGGDLQHLSGIII